MNLTMKSMTLSLLAFTSLGLSACGSLNVWPFSGASSSAVARARSDATDVRCDNNKGFYMKMLDGGSAVWLILAEREVRLDKANAASGSRYTNGKAVLAIDGDAITLTDAPTIAYSGCKVASAK